MLSRNERRAPRDGRSTLTYRTLSRLAVYSRLQAYQVACNSSAEGGQRRQWVECRKPDTLVFVQPTTGALGMRAWIQLIDKQEASATSAGLELVYSHRRVPVIDVCGRRTLTDNTEENVVNIRSNIYVLNYVNRNRTTPIEPVVDAFNREWKITTRPRIDDDVRLCV